MTGRSLPAAVFSLMALTLVGPASFAQTGPVRATAENGRVVILYPNGTWKYETPSAALQASPSGGFRVPPKATAHVDLAGGYRISYDPERWRPQKSTETNVHDFAHVAGDGYAKVIVERLEIPLPALKQIALDNAKEAAADARVTFEETRRVNGVDLLCMKLEGTMSGVAFVYYAYYYSSPRGAVQLITFTGRNLLSEYEPDFLDFLNGFQAPQQ